MRDAEVPPEVTSAAKEAIDRFKTEHGHEILFANISGAHLYGTASTRSDIDLRGCYIVPTSDLLRFSKPKDTIEDGASEDPEMTRVQLSTYNIMLQKLNKSAPGRKSRP